VGVRLLHDPSPTPGLPTALFSGARGLRTLSELARAGGTCDGRQRYRLEALAALRRAVPFDFGFIAAPSTGGSDAAALGATPGMLRVLTRHGRASWIELRALRAKAEEGVLQLAGGSGSSPLLGLLRTDRPVAALCVGWWSDDTAALVLGREREASFHGPELELLRLSLPVITLADAQAADLADSLGARLSPREEEIFAYLQRGYSNRQIALVLGTSPLTVRNQLARLFRKVGVSTRAELVGLTASCIRNGTR
jgi:DNA-binding CsgD family transcriptional regulator